VAAPLPALTRPRLAAGALLLALLAQAAAAPRLEAAFRNVAPGAKPPAFTLRDLDGQERASEALLGPGVSVLVFFAVWNPRSKEILADLERLRTELGPERVRLVAVNVEHEDITAADREAIRALAAEAGLRSPPLLDQGLAVFNAYGTMAVPSSLVVGADGRVAYTLAGYPLSQRSDLADAVRKALGLPTSVELRPPQEYVPKNHALMYYNFGRILLEKGQDEKALEQLRISTERDPAFKKSWIALGLLHRRRGEAEEARAAFLKAREIDPHDPEPSYQAALAGLRAGRVDEAAGIFAELATEFPDSGAYATALALARGFQGREAERRAGMERAAGLRPPEPRVLYDLGAAAEARGDRALAAELYRRALAAALP
jgi:Flp pilus assembly protein TadD/peroxiredoxin